MWMQISVCTIPRMYVNLLFILYFLSLSASSSSSEFRSFQKWLDRHHDGIEETSFVKILTGNALFHHEVVESIVQKSKIYHYNKKVSRLYIDAKVHGKGSSLEAIENFINGRSSHEGVDWSLVLISNGEQLDSFEVRELLEKFWNRKMMALNYKQILCHRLALIISTSFGVHDLNLYDKEAARTTADQNNDKERLETSIFKAIRSHWQLSMLYTEHRRLVEIVHGKLSGKTAAELIAHQSIQRVNAVQGKPLRSSADESFFVDAGFVGQKEVISRVSNALSAVKRGLKMSGGPLIFLFAGLPGTGKTFLAQIIAASYHYDSNSMDEKSINQIVEHLRERKLYLQVDMGNYQDDRAIDGFVDPSPGLEGDGLLSSLFQDAEMMHVSEQPIPAVIVLDEIEKAHPSLLKDMLLPVLDSNNGHIQQKKTGKSFSTRNAVFILTTNCFDDVVLDLHLRGKTYSQIVAAVGDLLSDGQAHCLSSNPSGKSAGMKNPFGWKPLWRRILAGQSLATDDNFLAFLPPSKADVEVLVHTSLESMHKKFTKKKSGVRGLFYSNKALSFLKKGANNLAKESLSMAHIESYVERTVANLILQTDLELNQIEQPVAVLYVNYESHLAMDIATGHHSSQMNQAAGSLSSYIFGSSIPEQKTPGKISRIKLSKSFPSETGSLSGSKPAYSESFAQMESEDGHLSSEESLQLALLALIMVALVYLFILPLVKSFILVTLLILSALYLVAPQLMKKLINTVLFLGKWIFWFIRSGGIWTLIYAVIAIYFIRLGHSIYQKKDTAVFSKSTWIKTIQSEFLKDRAAFLSLFRRNSRSEDIVRRWALLVLKLRVSRAQFARRYLRMPILRNRISRVNSGPLLRFSGRPDNRDSSGNRVRRRYNFFGRKVR